MKRRLWIIVFGCALVAIALKVTSTLAVPPAPAIRETKSGAKEEPARPVAALPSVSLIERLASQHASQAGQWSPSADWTEALKGISPINIAAAAAMLTHKLEQQDEEELREAIFGQWATVDPAAALDFAVGFSTVEQREAALRPLFNSWSSRAPAEAFAAALALPAGDFAYEILSSAARRWSETDPRAALAALAPIPPGAMRDQAFSDGLGNLASLDVAAALAFVQAAAPEQSDRWTAAIASRLARSDPMSALEISAALPDGPERQSIVAESMAELAKTDLPLAMSRATRLPDAERDAATRTFADHLAQLDPAAALQWARSLPAGDAGKSIASVFSQWAEADTADPLTAATSLPPAERNVAISTIANRWMSSDPESAVTLALQFVPEGSQRTAIIANVARVLVRENREDLLTIAAQLVPAERAHFIDAAVASFGADDPDAARFAARLRALPTQ